ncbi:alpha-amylase [Lachnospiraceae bacterium C7]|nr:alpha-amylase [Lachnospiraceae bacterium C7]
MKNKKVHVKHAKNFWEFSLKKTAGVVLATATIFTSIQWGNFKDEKVNTTQMVHAAESLQQQYGLQENVQDGVILHAWDWSFNNIKSHMKEIAESGYTSIQTSPIQPYKQAGDYGNGTNDTWWLFYQPTDFTVSKTKSQNLLGTEKEFKEMCAEADKYGIKIIVDVVANHVAATRTGGVGYDYSINDKLKRNDFFHNTSFPAINYGYRSSIINDSMGDAPNTLPDLNTENNELQKYILEFLDECIDDGADGFRFDAAKHIGVPADGTQYTFFPNVVNGAKKFYETNKRTAKTLYCYGEVLDNPGENTKGSDYTPYVNITDNGTSATIRNGVNGNPNSAATSYYQKNVSAKNIVLWAESHDEFQNEGGATRYTNIAQIKKAWAMVGSRANATSLFYARTSSYRSGNIGDITTNDWKSKEVIKVNKFHNEHVGEGEYLSSEDGVAYNERGTTGAVLVNCYGNNKNANVTAHNLENGTYEEKITGKEFKVENRRILGEIGSTGIAVIEKKDQNTDNPNTGKDDSSDEGTTVVPATNHRVYFKLPQGWNGNNIYCYAYGKNGSNKTWPGEKMIYDQGKDLYFYDVKEQFDHVMFTDNNNQYPGSGSPGLTFSGDSTAKEWIYQNGTWQKYNNENDEEADHVVYFRNTKGWKNPCAYMWNDTQKVVANNKEWPGEKMKLIDEKNCIYAIKVDWSKGYNHIIFSDNGNDQTADLDLKKDGTVY